MHNISRMMLYNQKNETRSTCGMSCKSLLRLCNGLNVTSNDLLKGLY